MEDHTDKLLLECEFTTDCDDLDEYTSSTSDSGISFPPAYEYGTGFSLGISSSRLDNTLDVDSSFSYVGEIEIKELIRDRPSIVEINFEDMEENITSIALPSSDFYREHDISYRKTPTNKRLPRSRPWGF